MFLNLPQSTSQPGATMAETKENLQARDNSIAALLLAHRDAGIDWGGVSHLEGRPCSKELANQFLLCCLLDWQMNSDVAWANGYRLVNDILGGPDDLWRAITSVTESEWRSKRSEYKLHRYRHGHDRLWPIATTICNKYYGDVRLIWKDSDSQEVLEKLWLLQAGDQISRMIVGALRDCGQIKNGASDVKGDVYVRRVLGRALLGSQTDVEIAVQLARRLHPVDPWQLDAALWQLGKSRCHTRNPKCVHCYLAPHCVYAVNERSKNEPHDRAVSSGNGE
jgi:hypothetical protein